jgi:hypothetical protein
MIISIWHKVYSFFMSIQPLYEYIDVTQSVEVFRVDSTSLWINRYDTKRTRCFISIQHFCEYIDMTQNVQVFHIDSTSLWTYRYSTKCTVVSCQFSLSMNILIWHKVCRCFVSIQPFHEYIDITQNVGCFVSIQPFREYIDTTQNIFVLI